MARPDQTLVSNRLLQALTAEDYALLQPHLEAVMLGKGTVLIRPDEPIEAAYFLSSGLGSVIVTSAMEQSIEIGLVGREGMIGLPLVLSSERTPYSLSMQIGGTGYRIAARNLQDACDSSASLHRLLLRYAHIFTVQIAYTALCNAVHSIDERLARWLLMSHDRQDSDDIPITHDFMATMLGVRRPSVTISLHLLQNFGFIRAKRGQVTIHNRPELEQFAGAAYGTPEAEYERMIGPLQQPDPCAVI